MPLRTRLRRAFTRSSQDDSSSISKTSSKDSKRKDSNVYQPGEKMPPLKYRRPVDKQHKENLEAFSFAKAWRRKSDQSIYSPMGSRMPSRKNSIVSFTRRSIGGRKGSSRGNDAIGVDSGVGSSIGDRDMSVGGEANIREGSDEEGDVANVGLSRQVTRDSQKQVHRLSTGRRSQSITSGGSQSGINAGRRSGSSKQDAPFTAEDLELALKKSHLDSPKKHLDTPHEVSSHGSPGSPCEPAPAAQTSET